MLIIRILKDVAVISEDEFVMGMGLFCNVWCALGIAMDWIPGMGWGCWMVLVDGFLFFFSFMLCFLIVDFCTSVR